jgi:hypothetical protein
MDGGGVTGFEEVSLPLLLHSPIQESCPTQRAGDKWDSYRQKELILNSSKFRQISVLPSHPLAANTDRWAAKGNNGTTI